MSLRHARLLAATCLLSPAVFADGSSTEEVLGDIPIVGVLYCEEQKPLRQTHEYFPESCYNDEARRRAWDPEKGEPTGEVIDVTPDCLISGAECRFPAILVREVKTVAANNRTHVLARVKGSQEGQSGWIKLVSEGSIGKLEDVLTTFEKDEDVQLHLRRDVKTVYTAPDLSSAIPVEQIETTPTDLKAREGEEAVISYIALPDITHQGVTYAAFRVEHVTTKARQGDEPQETVILKRTPVRTIYLPKYNAQGGLNYWLDISPLNYTC